MSASENTTRSSFRFDGGSPRLNTTNSLNLNINFAVAAALLALGGLAVYVIPELQTPTLHTILDTSIFQSSAILALLFWQVSTRTGQVSARILAISLTIVTLSEIIHTFTAIQWASNGGVVEPYVISRLTGTWGPSTYLFPISLLLLPVVQQRGEKWILAYAIVLAAFAVGLFWTFDFMPRFVDAGFLGITRPSLIGAPLLWLAVGIFYWQFRDLNEMTHAVALMAGLMIVPNVLILYSHGPYDAPALFAHLGKFVGRTFLLLSMTQLGARSSAQLVRAERDLQAFNLQLERRIRERTSELQEINERLVGEVDLREQTDKRLQTQLDRLNLLHEITSAIAKRIDLNSILQIAVRSLEERLPVDFACMLLLNPVRQKLVVGNIGVRSNALARETELAERSELDIDNNGLARSVLGDVVYEPDIEDSPYPFPKRLARANLRSLAIVPLIVDGRTFGVLAVGRLAKNAFSSSDCEFLRQLCEHTALAVRQAELHGTLQQAYDDLRQSHQTAMQHERLRAIGQMASGIAHDINNAISPVALYTQALLGDRTKLEPRIQTYLETVQRVTNDVAATVSRMREFYRARDHEPDLVPVALNVLVDQVIELTRARWSDMPQQRGVVIEVQRNLETDLPTVLGVESEIREALTNLVFNAIDAMPAGGTLTISTRVLETELVSSPGRTAKRVQLDVGDTGAGMSEEVRQRCFEPFYTTKGERGTGLGLAMVYGAAQRHNAEIEIESAVGKGTTVHLTFHTSSSVAAPESASPAEPETPPPPLRLLIIDDDPFVLDSMRVVLELDGHQVVEANGGREGIAAFQTNLTSAERFDVVITDLGMPHVDGNQVIDAVKTMSQDMPIILLTGWGRRLGNAGEKPSRADFVLPKPPNLDDLREVFTQIRARRIPAAQAASRA